MAAPVTNPIANARRPRPTTSTCEDDQTEAMPREDRIAATTAKSRMRSVRWAGGIEDTNVTSASIRGRIRS